MKSNLPSIPARRATATLVEHLPHRRDVARGRRRASLSDVVDLIFMWQERVRTRRHLHELDEHMLRDIGLSRGDALHEASKPFWH